MKNLKQGFKIAYLTGLVVIISLSFGTSTLAAGGDLALDGSSITLSKTGLLEGQKVRVYVRVNNYSNIDSLGTVQVSENKNKIGTDQVVSVVSQNTDTVFVDWIAVPGTHTITATINPWEKEGDNPANNISKITFFVDFDTDTDGQANQYDLDDDNDGIPDTEDAFPFDGKENKDTDGDGIGDNADEDDDNDGVPDTEDALPLDPNESMDTDGDGIGDNQDTDDDGDNITDIEEENLTLTDPKNIDTDADGVNDNQDEFPLDNLEVQDYDDDGIGDNSDNDADNDGLIKSEDPDDLNKGPIAALKREPGTLLPESTFIFDAGSSYDEDGKIEKYEWSITRKKQDQNENPEQEFYSGQEIEVPFDKPGTYIVELKVTDDKGESRTKKIELNVFNYIPYILLFALLIFGLALYIAFKYTSVARKRQKGQKMAKESRKNAVTPQKVKTSTKSAKKPSKPRKTTNSKKKS